MSVLLIDAGNTRLKWQLRGLGNSDAAGASVYGAPLPDWPATVGRVLVASVGEHASLQQQLRQRFGERLQWLGQPLPDYPHFHHCYEHPQRLGVDRWLALLGARRYAAGPLLVADAGTALTIDLLDADNRHQGGFIVPGLQLAQQALFQNTGRVRAFADEQVVRTIVPATDTLGCVSAGVLRQQLALLQSVQHDYPAYQVFVCGGDGEWLARQAGAAFYPDLVMDGMESLCAGYF